MFPYNIRVHVHSPHTNYSQTAFEREMNQITKNLLKEQSRPQMKHTHLQKNYKNKDYEQYVEDMRLHKANSNTISFAEIEKH